MVEWRGGGVAPVGDSVAVLVGVFLGVVYMVCCSFQTQSRIPLANTAPENEEGAKAESRTQVQRSSIVQPKAHPSTDTEAPGGRLQTSPLARTREMR